MAPAHSTELPGTLGAGDAAGAAPRREEKVPRLLQLGKAVSPRVLAALMVPKAKKDGFDLDDVVILDHSSGKWKTEPDKGPL